MLGGMRQAAIMSGAPALALLIAIVTGLVLRTLKAMAMGEICQPE